MRKNFMSKSPTLFLALFFLLLLFVLAVSLPASQIIHAQTGDGWITWEDYDAHLVYTPGWQIALPNPNAIGGQLSSTSTAGASMTFQIQVTEATGGYSIRYASGPDGGTFAVRINNTVRQYSSYSETEMYNREITDGSLPAGMYTIMITNGDGTFWLEAIQVQGTLLDNSEMTSTVKPTPTPDSIAEFDNSIPSYSIVQQSFQGELVWIVENTTELRNALNQASQTTNILHTIYIKYNAEGYNIGNTRLFLYGNLRLIGVGESRPTIRLSGSTNQAVIVVGADYPVELHHLVIEKGGSPSDRWYGGGVYNIGTVSIYDSIIQDNKAIYGAGGIFNDTGGNITLERTIVKANSAGGGGGILNYGNLTASCTTFEANIAGYGGGILNHSGTVTIQKSRFIDNVANLEVDYPGRDLYNLPPHGSFQVVNSYFSDPSSGYKGDENNGTGSGSSISVTGAYNSTNCQQLEVPPLRVAYIHYLTNYGITAYPAGVEGGTQSGGREWTVEELEAVIDAVEDTATALNLLKGGANSRETFRNIMGNLTFIRVENSYVGCLDETGNQPENTGCTMNDSNTIGFWGDIAGQRPTGFTKYLVVHELGHRFDYRAEIITGKSLENFVQGESPFRTILRDCKYEQGRRIEGNLVMGPIGGGRWLRGQTGWGTAGREVTLFQQNPSETFIETAADMFLNWVYRRLVDASVIPITNPCLGPATPPASAGFQNIDESGAFSATLPGNVRYWWMEDTMRIILNHGGWGQ